MARMASTFSFAVPSRSIRPTRSSTPSTKSSPCRRVVGMYLKRKPSGPSLRQATTASSSTLSSTAPYTGAQTLRLPSGRHRSIESVRAVRTSTRTSPGSRWGSSWSSVQRVVPAGDLHRVDMANAQDRNVSRTELADATLARRQVAQARVRAIAVHVHHENRLRLGMLASEPWSSPRRRAGERCVRPRV